MYSADHWSGFISAAIQHSAIQGINPLILSSWKRSFSAGVDASPDGIHLVKVSKFDLDQRLLYNHSLVTVAIPLIHDFSRRHSHLLHVIYLVDSEGIVLFSQGTDTMMRIYGLMPGYDWSEKAMGTNGAGTALASGRPVAVVGPDHYQLPFHDATCLASPIRSAQGDIMGAIDFSSKMVDARPEQLEDIVHMAATIEACIGDFLARSNLTLQSSD